MDYIDIHCHLDFPDYGEEIKDVFARMKENKVGAITIACDLASSQRAVKIAEEAEEKYGWPHVWACIGVHPAEALRFGEVWEGPLFEKLVQSPKVVGIGECGLDYFRNKDSERQIPLFKKQIEFALKHDKPLMLHCRAAYDETLEILGEYKEKLRSGEMEGGKDKLRGNSHFFAGNVEQAKKFVELGFSCSFTGVVTFTHQYDEVVKSLPSEMVMSETDAPFVAPVPYRGKRNEPAFVVEVVETLAGLRAENPESFKQILLQNAQRTFKIEG